MLVAKIAQRLLRLLLHQLGFAQPRIHRRVEVFNGERLGQVIVRSQFHSVPHARIVRQARHQNERNRRRGLVVAQRGKREVAVHLVHVYIAEDQVRKFLLRDFYPLRSVFRLDDVEAFLPKGHVDHLPQPYFVVDDQNLHVVHNARAAML